MKKRWRSFIALTLSIFLFIIVDSLTYSQLQAASNACNVTQSSSDRKIISEGINVYWEKELLFPITCKKIGDFNFKQRSEEISRKIQEIADDYSKSLDDLKVKKFEWRYYYRIF